MNVNSNIPSNPHATADRANIKRQKCGKFASLSLLKRDLYFLKKNLDLAYLFAAQLGVQRNK